jgi:hypothetical protein
MITMGRSMNFEKRTIKVCFLTFWFFSFFGFCVFSFHFPPLFLVVVFLHSEDLASGIEYVVTADGR